MDLGFDSKAVSWGNVPIVVEYLDSVGICTGFELTEELFVDKVPKEHGFAYHFDSGHCRDKCVKKLMSSSCRVFKQTEDFIVVPAQI